MKDYPQIERGYALRMTLNDGSIAEGTVAQDVDMGLIQRLFIAIDTGDESTPRVALHRIASLRKIEFTDDEALANLALGLEGVEDDDTLFDEEG